MARVVIGLSGGVDSSVAAWLLQQEGHEVIGLFMVNWHDTTGTLEGDCPWYDDRVFAELVAKRLDIPLHVVDLSAQYRTRVVDYMFAEYERGRTPNPDVLCNRVVKFGAFRDYCMTLGADFIATGHYCARDGDMLLKAADADKDQTYFLNQVKTEQLGNVLFPLGELVKPQVRAIAEELGLSVAHKKDSTGICFIGERKFKKFLAQYLPAQCGDITDVNGNVVGKHDGLMYYTLGQRRGLGIGGVKGETGRWFVLDKDVKNNRLIVSCGDESALYSRGLCGSELNTIGAFDMPKELRCTAKTRYRQPDQAATLFAESDGKFRLVFDEPQRAITAGQYAVIYVGERCLGGGVIEDRA